MGNTGFGEGSRLQIHGGRLSSIHSLVSVQQKNTSAIFTAHDDLPRGVVSDFQAKRHEFGNSLLFLWIEGNRRQKYIGTSGRSGLFDFPGGLNRPLKYTTVWGVFVTALACLPSCGYCSVSISKLLQPQIHGWASVTMKTFQRIVWMKALLWTSY